MPNRKQASFFVWVRGAAGHRPEGCLPAVITKNSAYALQITSDNEAVAVKPAPTELVAANL